MSRPALTGLLAVPAALFLVVIGAVHGHVNVDGLRRGVERGQIATRHADAVLVNAAFSGAALSLFGLLVLLSLPGLLAGNRDVRRVAAAIGSCSAGVGVLGYAWSPRHPSVLVFLLFGLLLLGAAWQARR
jgi:hypothetical protein